MRFVRSRSVGTGLASVLAGFILLAAPVAASSSPPAETATLARGTSRAAARRASISGHVKPGSVAPHVDAVTEETPVAPLGEYAQSALGRERLRGGRRPS